MACTMPAQKQVLKTASLSQIILYCKVMSSPSQSALSRPRLSGWWNLRSILTESILRVWERRRARDHEPPSFPTITSVWRSLEAKLCQHISSHVLQTADLGLRSDPTNQQIPTQPVMQARMLHSAVSISGSISGHLPTRWYLQQHHEGTLHRQAGRFLWCLQP